MQATTIVMQTAAAAMITLLTCEAAFAARLDTRRLTCAQGRAVVSKYKSIVMTTGQFTYARIVSNIGGCGPSQVAERKIVPSLDTPRCNIGYVCRESLIFHD